LRIEKICDWKYCGGDKVQEDWLCWACGGGERCLNGVVGEPEGNVPIARPGYR